MGGCISRELVEDKNVDESYVWNIYGVEGGAHIKTASTTSYDVLMSNDVVVTMTNSTDFPIRVNIVNGDVGREYMVCPMKDGVVTGRNESVIVVTQGKYRIRLGIDQTIVGDSFRVELRVDSLKGDFEDFCLRYNDKENVPRVQSSFVFVDDPKECVI